MKLFRPRLLPLAAGAACIFLLSGCQDKNSAQKQSSAPVPVTTLTVKSASQPFVIDTFGQTEGAEAVKVYPRVTGQILSRNYTEGTRVEKGALLFTIDPTSFEATYQSAKSAVDLAKVNLEQAEREERRYAALNKSQAVSQKDYADAVTKTASSKASLAAAIAKADEAKIQLDYTHVTAPVSGIAGRALVNPGALVVANSTQLTDITQEKELKARFSLSDREMHGFAVTDESPVQIIDPVSGKEVPAKIDFAGIQIDPQTGTRSLSANITDNATLLPGQYVTVRLTLGDQKGVFLVPQKAVRQRSDGTYSVYVLKEGAARERTVTVGRWKGADWIVTSGLKDGDEVIIDQIQKLKDKAKVVKKETDGKASSAGKGADKNTDSGKLKEADPSAPKAPKS